MAEDPIDIAKKGRELVERVAKENGISADIDSYIKNADGNYSRAIDDLLESNGHATFDDEVKKKIHADYNVPVITPEYIKSNRLSDEERSTLQKQYEGIQKSLTENKSRDVNTGNWGGGFHATGLSTEQKKRYSESLDEIDKRIEADQQLKDLMPNVTIIKPSAIGPRSLKSLQDEASSVDNEPEFTTPSQFGGGMAMSNPFLPSAEGQQKKAKEKEARVEFINSELEKEKTEAPYYIRAQTAIASSKQLGNDQKDADINSRYNLTDHAAKLSRQLGMAIDDYKATGSEEDKQRIEDVYAHLQEQAKEVAAGSSMAQGIELYAQAKMAMVDAEANNTGDNKYLGRGALSMRDNVFAKQAAKQFVLAWKSAAWSFDDMLNGKSKSYEEYLQDTKSRGEQEADAVLPADYRGTPIDAYIEVDGQKFLVDGYGDIQSPIDDRFKNIELNSDIKSKIDKYEGNRDAYKVNSGIIDGHINLRKLVGSNATVAFNMIPIIAASAALSMIPGGEGALIQYLAGVGTSSLLMFHSDFQEQLKEGKGYTYAHNTALMTTFSKALVEQGFAIESGMGKAAARGIRTMGLKRELEGFVKMGLNPPDFIREAWGTYKKFLLGFGGELTEEEVQARQNAYFNHLRNGVDYKLDPHRFGNTAMSMGFSVTGLEFITHINEKSDVEKWNNGYAKALMEPEGAKELIDALETEGAIEKKHADIKRGILSNSKKTFDGIISDEKLTNGNKSELIDLMAEKDRWTMASENIEIGPGKSKYATKASEIQAKIDDLWTKYHDIGEKEGRNNVDEYGDVTEFDNVEKEKIKDDGQKSGGDNVSVDGDVSNNKPSESPVQGAEETARRANQPNSGQDAGGASTVLESKKADIEKRKEELEKKYEETKERHLRELEKAGVDLGKWGIDFNDIIHNIEEENNSDNHSKEVEVLAKKQYEEWWALNREKQEIESDANRLSFSDYNFSNKQSILDRLKKAISKVYQSNRQALDEGFAEWYNVEREVATVGGNQYAAHGMGKTSIANAFTDLINLFEKGINPFRGQGALDVATLAGGISDGTTTGGAYMDGAFTLVANRNHNGRIENINQIGGIIVNEGIATPEVLSALKELFPNLVIESTLNSKSLVEQLNAKYDAELKAVEQSLKEEAKKQGGASTVLTPEAEELLANLTDGSKPLFISKRLEKIAKENGIEVTGSMSADDVVNALKDKKAYAELKASQAANEQSKSSTVLTDDIQDDEYNSFIDKGTVSNEQVVESAARKIILNQELTAEERQERANNPKEVGRKVNSLRPFIEIQDAIDKIDDEIADLKFKRKYDASTPYQDSEGNQGTIIIDKGGKAEFVYKGGVKELGNVSGGISENMRKAGIVAKGKVQALGDNRYAIDGVYYQNNLSNPSRAVFVDEKGNISVELDEVQAGYNNVKLVTKSRKFTGPQAEELAYQIHLEKISKDEKGFIEHVRQGGDASVSTETKEGAVKNNDGLRETTTETNKQELRQKIVTAKVVVDGKVKSVTVIVPDLKKTEAEILEMADKGEITHLEALALLQSAFKKNYTNKELNDIVAKSLGKKEEAGLTETTLEELEHDAEVERDNSLFAAEERRDNGEFKEDGVTYKRNEPSEGIKGKSGEVRFASGVVVPFTYKLVEADRVQPSHQRGVINKRYFISEAQPKPRTGDDSINAENGFADNPRFNELGQSPNAYSGAPVAMETDEVIQGHNRASGIKEGYVRYGNNYKYKNALIGSAERFGFTKEQVEGMANPMLVREVEASDEKAIELGNYDVKDLETGGKRRVDPIAVSRRIPYEVKNRILKLLFSGAEGTTNQQIKKNEGAIIKLVSPFLNATQRATLVKDGQLTASGVEDMESLVEYFIFDGGDIALQQLFDNLTHTQREGLKRALPFIYAVPRNKGLLKELQVAILVLNEFKASGLDFNSWLNQTDVFNDGMRPVDKYIPIELALAKKLDDARNQTEIKAIFSDYADLVNGTSTDLFREATEGIGKKEAIKQQFNVTYNERQNEKQNKGSGEKVSGEKEADIKEEVKAEEVKPEYEWNKKEKVWEELPPEEGDNISSFNVGDIIERGGKRYKILGNSKGKNEGVVKLQAISDDLANGAVSNWNAENNGGFTKVEQSLKETPIAGSGEQSQPTQEEAKTTTRKIRDEALRDEADEAFRAFRKSLGKNLSSGGLDPDSLEKGIKLIGVYIKAGVYKFSDIVEDAVEEFGDVVKEMFDALKVAYTAYYGASTDEEAQKMDVISARKSKFEDIIKPKANEQQQIGAGREGLDRVHQGVREGLFQGADEKGALGETSNEGDGIVSQEGGGAKGQTRLRTRGRRGGGKNVPLSKPVSVIPDLFAPQPEVERLATEQFVSIDEPPIIVGTILANPAPLSNYVPDKEEDTAKSFSKTKHFAKNLKAIKTLLSIVKDGDRLATSEEKEILSDYVGWGGIKAVNRIAGSTYWSNSDLPFKPMYQELLGLVSEFEGLGYKGLMSDISRSTQNAHYTTGDVIRGVYYALNKLGFTGGTILEPSAGIGNFIGYAPKNVLEKSSITAIELDKFTGKILEKLYPSVYTKIKGYQEVKITNGTIDLVISNIPFGNYNVTPNKGDSDIAKRAAKRIHNYFFVKAIEQAREGGLVAFVTSTGVLDSPGNEFVRNYINDNTEFIGAIRLPNTTFKVNAGTEVVTDILFLKKNSGPKTNQDMVQISEIAVPGGNVPINNYFVNNPNHVIGDIKLDFGLNGKELVVEYDGNDIEGRIKDIVDKQFPANVYARQSEEFVDTEKVGEEKVENRIAIDDEGVFVYNNNERKPIDVGKEKARAFIDLRNALDRQYKLESSPDASDNMVEQNRAELNKLYDKFIGVFGMLNAPKNIKLVLSDKFGYNVLALERVEGGRTVKADIFKSRGIVSTRKATKASNIEDAVAINYNETGVVNVNRIASLLGVSPDRVVEDNYGVLFYDSDGTVVGREDYLSGNVKKKYKEALALAESNEIYQQNVDALAAVIPKDIPIEEIDINIGQRWVPLLYYKEFADFIFKTRTKIKYDPIIDSYAIDGNRAGEASVSWAIGNMDGFDLLIHAMHGSSPAIYMSGPTPGSRVIDPVNTQLANEKVEKLGEEFKSWVAISPERAGVLQGLYNDSFNTNVKRQFSDVFTVNGMSYEIILKEHQKAGANMIVANNGGIIDHMVGAGKTFLMISAALKMRQLGVANKPMIVGLKSTIQDLASDAKKLFPMAKVLSPSEADFSKENRKRLLATIQNNDWDLIIISHKQFGAIPQDKEFHAGIIDKEIEEIEAALAALEEESGEAASRKLIQGLTKRKENLRSKLAELADFKKDDEMLSFKEIGIDHLFVDESQFFKNLAYTTRINRVSGLGNPLGSKRSYNMLVAARTLQAFHGGDKGLTFVSGTPISNSLVEMYLLLKYLRPKRMQELGYTTFDAWVNQFAIKNRELEFTVAGGIKEKTRFREFVNVPELSLLYNEVADVRNEHNLTIKRPTIRGGKPMLVAVKQSEAQQEWTNRIIQFAEQKQGQRDGNLIGKGHLTKEEQSAAMLMITTIGNKLSNDIRLVDKNADFNPEGKLVAVANKVMEEYENSKDIKGTQLIFSDIGTPKTGKVFDDIMSYLEDEKNIDFDTINLIFGEPNEESGLRATKPIKQIRERIKEYLGYSDTEIDYAFEEAKNSSLTSFNTYNEIKRLLVQKGIPANEIAFIHDYKNKNKRKSLFADVNSGKVRVVIGSTQKLGTGVNVQERIVAMHHVDAKWTPSDMEQRNGRGVRQGNINSEVAIFQYGTEQTVDAYKYQLIATKQRFIDQVKLGALSGERTIKEDEGENMSAQEFVALLSGNPLLLEKAKLEASISKLSRSSKAFIGEQSRIRMGIVNNERAIPRQEEFIEKRKRDMETASKNMRTDEDGKVLPIWVIDYKQIDDPKLRRELIEAKIGSLKGKGIGYSVVIGQVAGLNYVARNVAENVTGRPKIEGQGGLDFSEIKYELEGEMVYGTSSVPFNTISSFADNLVKAEKVLVDTKKELESYIGSVKSVWPKEDELKEAKKRLADVINELTDVKAEEGEKQLQSTKDKLAPLDIVLFDKLLKNLNKAIKGVFGGVFEGKEFAKIVKSKAGVEISTIDGTVYGFVGNDGKIYLNGDHINANTPIHEYGHVWINIIKDLRPDIYSKGLELIAKTPYVDKVRKNTAYKGLSKAQIMEEALAMAIGDRGESIIGKAPKAKFKEWVKDFWEKIKGLFKGKITDLTPEQVSKLSVVEFLDLVAGQLVAGEEVVAGSGVGGDVVYHGSPIIGEKGDLTPSGGGELGAGVYFTRNEGLAKNYSKPRGEVKNMAEAESKSGVANLDLSGLKIKTVTKEEYLNKRSEFYDKEQELNNGEWNLDVAKRAEEKLIKQYEKEGYDGLEVVDEQQGVIFPDSVKKAKHLNKKAVEQSLKETTQFQIIGRTGAERLENAAEVMANYEIAQKLKAEGKSDSLIWGLTHWNLGGDGKWKTEIPYGEMSEMVIDKEFERALAKALGRDGGYSFKDRRLSEVFDAPELFKAYLQLRNIPTSVVVDPSRESDGSFTGKRIFVRGRSVEEVRSSIIHEVQHAVQDIEGFGRGSSLMPFYKTDIDVRHWLEAFVEGGVTTEEFLSNPEVEEIMRATEVYDNVKSLVEGKTREDIVKHLKEDDDQAFRQYIRVAGEVEARNASKRASMSKIDLAVKNFAATEEVSEESKIYIEKVLEDNYPEVKEQRSEALNQKVDAVASARERLNNAWDAFKTVGVIHDDWETAERQRELINAGVDYIFKLGLKAKQEIVEALKRNYDIMSDKTVNTIAKVIEYYYDPSSLIDLRKEMTSYKDQASQIAFLEGVAKNSGDPRKIASALKELTTFTDRMIENNESIEIPESTKKKGPVGTALDFQLALYQYATPNTIFRTVEITGGNKDLVDPNILGTSMQDTLLHAETFLRNWYNDYMSKGMTTISFFEAISKYLNANGSKKTAAIPLSTASFVILNDLVKHRPAGSTHAYWNTIYELFNNTQGIAEARSMAGIILAMGTENYMKGENAFRPSFEKMSKFAAEVGGFILDDSDLDESTHEEIKKLGAMTRGMTETRKPVPLTPNARKKIKKEYENITNERLQALKDKIKHCK